jgi:S-disulfanyl-L-cysteine oxidoreductase SoxD
MPSARFEFAAAAAALAILGCAQIDQIASVAPAQTAEGIPLGKTAPHPVQPLKDKPRFGHAVSEADLAALNIDIRAPDGKGLPAGRGSVADGKKIYEAQCVACHGADAKGGAVYGTMVGGIGSMNSSPRVLTPGSMYPYAPILFDYIRRAMPMDRPQTLSNDDVYALSAYLLNLNGLVPADAVMDAQSLAKVQMPNRNGFIVDSRPDVKAVRCMADCK